MRRNPPDFIRLARLTEEKKETFLKFFGLLTEYNGKFNLTSVTEIKEVVHKHFLDSLAAEEFLPRGALCAEVGSGAGFPSIPLAIVRSDLRFVLIESTGKKCSFLETAARELSLPNIKVVCARAEDTARGELREKADICVSRAVARMNTLAEYCLPLVKIGGEMIAYKGAAEEEVNEARPAFRILGGEEEEILTYSLPEGYGERSLVFVKKRKPTPAGYPRGHGAERRNPLK